jgi:two-component system, cell cycle response regulator
MKASAPEGKTRWHSAQPEVSREAELTQGKAAALTQRLKEARFTVGFCRAVYAQLDPETVCSTAASWLNDFFRYRLALFSFARGVELESVAFVPTRTESGGTELQRLVLDALHAGATLASASRRSNGVMGAEVTLSLPDGLGELRLYQVEGELPRPSRSFLAGIAECLAAALGKARDHTRLRELALRDAMTGLFNRRAFEELLVVEGERRGDLPLSLLMIDIDNFKSINDQYGHPVGDEVIVAVGKAISEECRGGDLAARYGGEEFVVLLPGAGVANAAGVAERIRGRIAAIDFSFNYADFAVTGSFGVACRNEPQGCVKELVQQADSALYLAKRGGKNRVSVHEAPEVAVLPAGRC